MCDLTCKVITEMTLAGLNSIFYAIFPFCHHVLRDFLVHPSCLRGSFIDHILPAEEGPEDTVSASDPGPPRKSFCKENCYLRLSVDLTLTLRRESRIQPTCVEFWGHHTSHPLHYSITYIHMVGVRGVFDIVCLFVYLFCFISFSL